MTVMLGRMHKEDGSSDFALAEKDTEGEGLKVVSFPEPGGQYVIDHHVATGNEPGEFST